MHLKVYGIIHEHCKCKTAEHIFSTDLNLTLDSKEQVVNGYKLLQAAINSLLFCI